MALYNDCMEKLTPRKITLDTAGIPRYWAAGMVYPTHFLNAISLSFPMMEKMAVVAMKAAAKQLEDEALKEELRLFCIQENNHSAIHHAFNKKVLEGGAEPESCGRLNDWCKEVSKRPTKERVCIVIAFEYFTGSCARLLMRTLDEASKNGKIDSESFKLWYWHCAEEIEHHGVGWDLVEPFGINKSDLNAAVREYFTVFYPYLFACTKELIERDGEAKKVKTWLGASVFLTRHFKRMGPYFLSFFSPSFGPHSYAELDEQLMQEFMNSGVEYFTE